MIKSFKKCGFSDTLYGYEDHKVNIEGIQNYDMPKPDADERFSLSDDENNNNESDIEANHVESDKDKFNFIYDEEISLVAIWRKMWFDNF